MYLNLSRGRGEMRIAFKKDGARASADGWLSTKSAYRYLRLGSFAFDPINKKDFFAVLSKFGLSPSSRDFRSIVFWRAWGERLSERESKHANAVGWQSSKLKAIHWRIRHHIPQ